MGPCAHTKLHGYTGFIILLYTSELPGHWLVHCLQRVVQPASLVLLLPHSRVQSKRAPGKKHWPHPPTRPLQERAASAERAARPLAGPLPAACGAARAAAGGHHPPQRRPAPCRGRAATRGAQQRPKGVRGLPYSVSSWPPC